MATIDVTLPVPSANGVGAAVDTSAMGADKTILVAGNFSGTVIIEFSCGGGVFSQVATFTRPGDAVIPFAAVSMRARMTGYISGSADCSVSSSDLGALFVTLPVPAGNGVGAPVDITALGSFMTAQCVITGGSYVGSVTVEISPDGVDWGDPFRTFVGSGFESEIAPARFARVRQRGTDPLFPGQAAVFLGAINDSSSGGGTGFNDAEIVTYTATGVEVQYLVTLPTTRPDPYEVWHQLRDVENHVTISVPDATRGTTQFEFIPSAQLFAGDTVTFFIVEG